MAVLLNTGDNEVNLSLVQELLAHARLVSKLGEVDDEVPSNQADDDSDDTLKDEDPPPASETGAKGDRSSGLGLGGTVVDTEPGSSLYTVTLKQGEQVAENAGEGGR